MHLYAFKSNLCLTFCQRFRLAFKNEKLFYLVLDTLSLRLIEVDRMT